MHCPSTDKEGYSPLPCKVWHDHFPLVKALEVEVRAFRKSELDKQEAKGLARVSLIEAHLIGHIGNVQKIHQS